ncbi:hypothetical protein K504DRAFT_389091 [Pleomassaria siparia CBS 279.74]|uniref:Cora-domain-containing protein n=1 Tax=Pleomassaria siparia CBS 279.74 TaxID=1314801 RepID=A0A6G1JX44_9PLEO|nr:hypothetical protein K504DRAFT_389091 [Pleomassaria siparia CBS 279.74]
MDAIPTAPSPAPGDDDEKKIGTWLCEEGPYQEYIAAMSGSNPGLKTPDPMNVKNHPLKPGNALVILLDAQVTETPVFKSHEFRSAAELGKHLNVDMAGKPRRRIYLMEGLAQDYINVIGSHFFMEPSFFLRQERTCVWSNDFTPTSDALAQPSLLTPKRMFHLQYCELRKFSEAMENNPFFCKRTGRHVGMTPARDKEQSTVSILRRKISWWCRETEGGGWDAVILCDPQLYEIVSNGGKDVSRKVVNFSFQEGYVDFLPPPSRERIISKPRHPHRSMQRDLCYYFLHQSDLIPPSSWTTPVGSTIFLKKIVAAHLLQLVDYIKVMLPSLELHLTTAWVKEQDQWRSLQTLSRRCGNYTDDIEDTLLSLGYSVKDMDSNRVEDWKDCEKDFQYIYFRLKILKQRADTLMQAMTGLASIAGNRQNLEEAKRVKRLNLLALLFIPLAYTSSLFSMQDAYAPNNSKFWVYWVVAIGAVSVTLFATWVLDSALDDAAQWTLPFNLSGKRKNVQSRVTRKKTGLGLYE